MIGLICPQKSHTTTKVCKCYDRISSWLWSRSRWVNLSSSQWLIFWKLAQNNPVCLQTMLQQCCQNNRIQRRKPNRWLQLRLPVLRNAFNKWGQFTHLRVNELNLNHNEIPEADSSRSLFITPHPKWPFCVRTSALEAQGVTLMEP